MASSALPLLFPPVCVGDSWHGDGGIRLVAPLSPALHLGADRMLVLSTHYAFPEDEPMHNKCVGSPSPAVILGALYDAVFLDQLDQDVVQLDRINRLVRAIPTEQRQGFRDVKTIVIRPSEDLGDLANHYESKLPPIFRYFMRRFGSGETKSQDFVSTVMFHEGYIAELLRQGERDAAMRADALAQFLKD
jgi:NTE family protein